MPVQPSGATDVEGFIRIRDEFVDGLADLCGFSHLFLIYCLDRAKGMALKVTPFLDDSPHGVFATRAPRRPNPIGLSVVSLVGIEGNRILIRGVDMLDRTPLLDIKPYVPDFDAYPGAVPGWFQGKSGKARTFLSDHRYLVD